MFEFCLVVMLFAGQVVFVVLFRHVMLMLGFQSFSVTTAALKISYTMFTLWHLALCLHSQSPPDLPSWFMLFVLIFSCPCSRFEGTIWETLSSDESFSLLTAALNGTKLARSLDTADGRVFYTFFAPDNDAIRASPAGLPEGLKR